MPTNAPGTTPGTQPWPQWPQLSQHVHGQIRKVLIVSLAVYLMLFWMPSAYNYYGGGGADGESAADRDTFSSSAPASFDTEAPVKLITRQAVASILQGLEGAPLGFVSANLSAPHDSRYRGLVGLSRGSFDKARAASSPVAAVVWSGVVAFGMLNEDGSLERCYLVGQGQQNIGIEIDQGQWYIPVAASQKAVFFVSRSKTQWSDGRTPSPSVRTRSPSVGTPSLLAPPSLPGVPDPGSPEADAFAKRLLGRCSSLATPPRRHKLNINLNQDLMLA